VAAAEIAGLGDDRVAAVAQFDIRGITVNAAVAGDADTVSLDGIEAPVINIACRADRAGAKRGEKSCRPLGQAKGGGECQGVIRLGLGHRGEDDSVLKKLYNRPVTSGLPRPQFPQTLPIPPKPTLELGQLHSKLPFDGAYQ